MSKPRIFTTLPLKAIADRRLSALDVQCIAAIALYDGMSIPKGKGAGCYASHATLAARLGIDITSLSRTLNRLESMGYIVRDRQTQDRRRKTIRVLYDGEDSCPDGQVNGGEQPGEMVDDAVNNRSEIVDRPDNHIEQILDDADSESPENPPKTSPYYIPLNGELDSDNQGLDSIEMARPFAALGGVQGLIEGAGRHLRKVDTQRSQRDQTSGHAMPARQVRLRDVLSTSFASLSPDAQVAKLERVLKDADWQLDRLADADANHVLGYLEAVALELHGEPAGYRAARLLDQLDAAA